MPPTDYRPVFEGAAVAAVPFWLRLKTAWKNWRLRNDKDAVEGHRVLGDKKK